LLGRIISKPKLLARTVTSSGQFKFTITDGHIGLKCKKAREGFFGPNPGFFCSGMQWKWQLNNQAVYFPCIAQSLNSNKMLRDRNTQFYTRHKPFQNQRKTGRQSIGL